MSEWNKNKMEEWMRNDSEDPFRFTKQTAMMLVGLGASDMIPEFKKRNISSRNLVELGRKDLIVLGANEKLANHMLRELGSAARKFRARNVSDERRPKEKKKMLMSGNNRLNLMETFVAYAHLRLAEKPNDFVIDSRKNIRASQALCTATVYTIEELRRLERNFKRLASELMDNNGRSVKKLCLLELITGIGLIGSLAFALKYSLYPVVATR